MKSNGVAGLGHALRAFGQLLSKSSRSVNPTAFSST